jgi:hypothetical protein
MRRSAGSESQTRTQARGSSRLEVVCSELELLRCYLQWTVGLNLHTDSDNAGQGARGQGVGGRVERMGGESNQLVDAVKRDHHAMRALLASK